MPSAEAAGEPPAVGAATDAEAVGAATDAGSVWAETVGWAVSSADRMAEGADLEPLALALGRQLWGQRRELALVVAQGALLALPDDAADRLMALEIERRGLGLVRLGLHDATLLEGALLAASIIDQLTPQLRRDVLRMAAQAAGPLPPGAARERMAQLFLDLPEGERAEFLGWAGGAAAGGGSIEQAYLALPSARRAAFLAWAREAA